MRLNLEQIRAAACGAVQVTEEKNGFWLHRFTEAQEKLYIARKNEDKTRIPVGIALSFRTDSRTLTLSAVTEQTSSRWFFAFDVSVNGAYIGSMDNYCDRALPPVYAGTQLPHGEFTKTFDLGEGEKTVRIQLPYSAKVLVSEVTLEEGSSFVPVKRPKKLLCFGDSITQGYDALHPSRTYTSRLADMLDAEQYNKGVGGERFIPELARLPEEFVPDCITVAYGTNDWGKMSAEDFTANCRAFFENLRATYPDTPVFAVTPVWRADLDTERPMGPFGELHRIIAETADSLPQVYVVDGRGLIPPETSLFGDGRLHPADEGFAHFAENLYAAMTEYHK